MPIFIRRREEGDKVIYEPIGKRGAILAIASLVLMLVSWAVFFTTEGNRFAFYAFIACTFWFLLLPSFISWIDQLSIWHHPQSGQRYRGFQVLGISFTGKPIVLSKEREQQLAAAGRTISRNAFIYNVALFLLLVFILHFVAKVL